MSSDAPWHAHLYFGLSDRSAAEALRDRLLVRANGGSGPHIRYVGRMVDAPVGPHPIPQYEIHFDESERDAVVALIAASGLRALIHPLTNDDLADHTALAHWIGEPVELDTSVLDPPGLNQGMARFGISDF